MSCVYHFYHGDVCLYIGSTVNFERRLSAHRVNFDDEDRKEHDKVLYLYMRTNSLKFSMIRYVVWMCQTETRQELFECEQEAIELLGPITNAKKAWTGLAHEEYQLQYRQQNRESAKTNNKVYRQLNHTKLLEKARKYEYDNRVAIAIRRGVSVKCACGSTYTLKHKARHFKSKKHIAFIARQTL